MAKKKTSSKKHRFKYAQPTGGVATAPAATVNEAAATTPRSAAAAPAVALPGTDYRYVGHDLRRLAVLAVSLLLIELILWFLFGHTGLGNTVDNLIHVS